MTGLADQRPLLRRQPRHPAPLPARRLRWPRVPRAAVPLEPWLQGHLQGRVRHHEYRPERQPRAVGCQPGDRWRGRAHELGIAAETPSPTRSARPFQCRSYVPEKPRRSESPQSAT